MAFDLSFGSLDSARERLTRLREDSDSKLNRAGNIVATGAAAFGFAWMETRFKAKYPNLVAPLNVPISAIIGTALSAAAIFDFAFGYEDYAASVGAGALAFVGSSYGASMGTKAAAAAGAPAAAAAMNQVAAAPATTATKGLNPGLHISAQHMQQMQQQGRRQAW
jgi:hypothetical protein